MNVSVSSSLTLGLLLDETNEKELRLQFSSSLRLVLVLDNADVKELKLPKSLFRD